MKYIRTNKEILYLVSEPIYADDGACEQDCYECITSKGKTRYIYENDIVKQADTIEELCDLFAYNKTFVQGRMLQEIKRYSRYHGKGILYAYIFGENGDIIKVAKMNDKGELELL